MQADLPAIRAQVFRGFPQPIQEIGQIRPSNRSRTPLSKSILIRHNQGQDFDDLKYLKKLPIK
jgi:hypothetical protein